jgi:hypothetical protein
MTPRHSLLAILLLCVCSLSCRPPEPDGEAATAKEAREERAEAALDALSAADVNGTRMSILFITRKGERGEQMDLKVRLVCGPHQRDLDWKGRAYLSFQSYDDKGKPVGMYDHWTMDTNWERGPDHKSVYTCYFFGVEVLPRATHVAVGHAPHYTKPVAIP